MEDCGLSTLGSIIHPWTKKKKKKKLQARALFDIHAFFFPSHDSPLLSISLPWLISVVVNVGLDYTIGKEAS